MTTSVPNTPSELVKQNTQVTPEEIWDRVKDLSPSDLQTFTWNCVNSLQKFHTYMVKDMIENPEEYPDSDLNLWVKDLTIYTMVLDQLNKITD